MAFPVNYYNSSGQQIQYIGTTPDYYGNSQYPTVLQETHVPLVSAYELDALELSSHGSITLTTDADQKAVQLTSSAGGTDTLVNVGDQSANVQAADVHMLADKSVVTATTSTGTLVGSSTGDRSEMHTNATNMSLATNSAASGGKGGALETSSSQGPRLSVGSASIDVSSPRVRMRSTVAEDFFVGNNANASISVENDRILISHNIDIQGQLNSISATNETLAVEDNIIKLVTSNIADSELSQNGTGMLIDTVPTTADPVGDFKAADGSALFLNGDSTVNVTKARDSSAFAKQLAFMPGDGARMTGGRIKTVALREPAWNLEGGSIRLTRDVPVGPGSLRRYCMCMRVDDDGNLEVNRITQPMTWNDTTNKFVEGVPIVDTMVRFDRSGT